MNIENGTCYVLFAYDVALSIDLDEAERRLSNVAQRGSLKSKHPAPAHFEYQPAPVRVTQTVEVLAIGDYRTAPTVDLIFYNFGAVSAVYNIPLQGTLSELRELSETLYDNELLLADSQQRVEQILSLITPALSKVELPDVVEDYVIFQIREFSSPCSPEELRTIYPQEIAQILRAEKQLLSSQEIHEALSQRLSFGLADAVFVDWHAALIFDKEGDDVRSVLEFANVELLEMRYLDHRLDDALDRSYNVLSRRRTWAPLRVFGSYRADLRQVALLQADSAILFEGVNNALKLLGDQYLARVYRLASQRFHLSEWDGSILRKLETLESIYQKMSDDAANQRIEILEWIIIILIAVEIVLSFFPDLRAH
ncbi:MAG: hypothetical protein AB7G75_19600 [Candidatus Binatia bacterium]